MNPTTPPDREPSESSTRAGPASSTTSPAQRIYLDFAESVEGLAEGELAAKFERLCELHPEHAGELRRLRALEAGVERLLEGGPGFFRPEGGGAGEPRRAEGLARSFAPGETIGDFELVRVEGDTVLSKSGDVAGTYHYMSPEQVAGARSQVDMRTDIFSLGVVLYELLTLQRPSTATRRSR